jgi:hypothetical protein
MYVWRNTEILSSNNFYRGKAISIAYSEFLCVALVVYHAKRVRSVILAPLALPHFSTLSNKGYDFEEKVTERKMCVLMFSAYFVRNISYSRKNSARYCHKCEKSSCKVRVILVRFQLHLKFVNKFSKKFEILNLIKKTLVVGAELFHADRPGDMPEVIVAFRNFAIAPNKRRISIPSAEFEPAILITKTSADPRFRPSSHRARPSWVVVNDILVQHL